MPSRSRPAPPGSNGPMIISPPSTRAANPDHTPVDPVPGFATRNASSSSPRRYPSPAAAAASASGGGYGINPFEETRTPSPASGTGFGGRRGKKGDDVDRLGAGGYEEYDLQPSPTHAYLEAFDADSPPHTPEMPPHHGPGQSRRAGGSGSNNPYAGIGLGSPAMHSPAMSSPGLDVTEKDPLEGHTGVAVPGEFGMNQYSSDRFLAPSSYPSRMATADRSPSSGFGPEKGYARSRSRSKKRAGCLPTNPTKRRWVCIGVPLALVLVIAGAAVGVYFGVVKKPGNAAGGSGASGSGTGSGSSDAYNATLFGVAGSGKNGSIVTTDLGVQFQYINWFEGTWAQNPLNPYSVSGRAQSWSPSILERWVWGQHIVRGVNLGGWLVTEPFIVPGLYEQYQTTTPQAVDEYTLSQAMGADLATKMEEHYRTFITEQDFADIARAGLNWVRLPFGYWAVETNPNEPYLAKVSWQYVLKAIGWGRKYGIRILLGFHGLPGSQNGWNHSGKAGSVNWMRGVMGLANAQRHLEQIRSVTQFLSQDGIKQVVPALSLVNEVQATVVGDLNLRSFYYQAYNLIRGITGYGANNGPIIVVHEGFEGIAAFNGFMAGADRLAIDQHPYLAFGDQNLANHSTQARIPCTWGGGTNDTQTSFGIVLGGEWSNAINNCGKWLNGVGSGNSYNSIPGSLGCTFWEEWFKWNDDVKRGILAYNMATMDALQNWFFWTWRIGNSTEMQYPTSPQWHYKLGVENGWIPADPRAAGGFCRSMGIGGGQFAGIFPASATGAVSSSVAPANTSAIAVWPPTSIGPSFTNPAQIALFPTFTQTGPIMVMPTATHPANITIGNGWAAPRDTAGAYVSVAGCSYPNPYDATAASNVPQSRCTGSGPAAARTKRGEIVLAAPTPTPTPCPLSGKL